MGNEWIKHSLSLREKVAVYHNDDDFLAEFSVMAAATASLNED